MQDFAGIWVPLITPFTEGAIDHFALKRLVHSLVPRGITGFVVCGSLAGRDSERTRVEVYVQRRQSSSRTRRGRTARTVRVALT